MAYPRRPIPAGFIEAAKTARSTRELQNRFHCTFTQARRWLDENRMEIFPINGCLPVVMFDLNTGAEVDRFPSLKAAAKAIYGEPNTIAKCARGIYKTAYGFGWRFANELSV